MKTQTKGILITLLAAACFGASSPIAKGVYSYGVAAADVLLWRFIIATVLIWAYILLFRKDLNIKLRKDQLILLAIAGGVMHFLATQCYFNALQYIPICIQIMIYYTYPFIVNILSVIFFRERMTRAQMLALLAAFAGILMTVSMDDLRMNLVGILLCVGAAFSNSAYILLLAKKSVMQVDSVVIGAYLTTFACISYIIWTFFTGDFYVEMPALGWLGTASMAIFTTIIGAIALSVGVKYIGSAKAAIVSVFEPIEAILLGVILFHERLSVKGWIGIVLVMGAIILVNFVQMQVVEKSE